MTSISDGAWERIVTEVREAADRAERAGARTHAMEITDQQARLEVTFDDPQRAYLYMDFHRPSASVCGAFGEEDASFSDYPMSDDALDWFFGIMHAVADGRLHGEVFTLWKRTVVRLTTLDIDGVPMPFYSGLPFLERLPYLTIERRAYRPWQDIDASTK